MTIDHHADPFLDCDARLWRHIAQFLEIQLLLGDSELLRCPSYIAEPDQSRAYILVDNCRANVPQKSCSIKFSNSIMLALRIIAIHISKAFLIICEYYI